MGRQSLSGSDNTWIYWLIGILLFLGLMAWLGLHKPKRQREFDSWLQKHYDGLQKEAQDKLMELRSERRGKPQYPGNWQAVSAGIHRRQPTCEVCGGNTRHVHHRVYRRHSRHQPGDLIALCDMCHYWIHPRREMTLEAFNQYRQGG